MTLARRICSVSIIVGLTFLAGGCSGTYPRTTEVPPMSNGLSLTSPAFSDGAPIPRRNSCQGDDLSPPLRWSGAPPETSAFALIVDDRDARGFVHWVVTEIPGGTTELPEGVPASGPGAPAQGRNDFGRIGWGGPCPPPGSGDHHYVFALFALASPLGVGQGASAATVRSAANGKMLATAVLEGTYRR